MMQTSHERYLELWRVTKVFGGPHKPVAVVEDFNLMVRKGEFVSLIGHSGCGKSTVLSMVAGLTDLSTGGIVLAGREIDGAGPDRGMVFQSPSLLPWMTALDNVTLGVREVRPTDTRQQCATTALEYLKLVGLGDAAKKYPGQLSQGMRQRVGLARAFALKPKMLLLDEPFGMLDSLTRYDLQQVLIDLWNREGITALMVTHDVDEALFLSDRVVMMTNGPRARVGDILSIPFARPRHRAEVTEHPDYYRLREHLVGFLEGQSHHPQESTPMKPVNKTAPTMDSENHVEWSATSPVSENTPVLATNAV